MRYGFCRLKAAAILLAVAASAMGQNVPWNIYSDDLSDSVCDTLNAANVELVVLSDNGPLVIITGPDLILADYFVSDAGFIFLDGDPVGFIDFAEDGDGFRTLWWLTLTGTVVFVDPFSGEPSDSGLFPDEFIGVPCDACELWDDPFDCGGVIVDSDLDGISDPFDFCPATPLGADVDLDGCACFELDSDFDGVDDCIDECPGTRFFVDVDAFGCECLQLDSDLDGILNCFDLCPGTPLDEFANLAGCSCSQVPGCSCFIDSDLDGVPDCDDFCPDTPLGALADFDGCACFEVDSDSDGVDDCDDECPNTPITQPANARGCSCDQVISCRCALDQDLDGVGDCDDDCPNTPLNAEVDQFGCEPDIIVNPPPITIACGTLNALTLGLGFMGLAGLRVVSRRRWG